MSYSIENSCEEIVELIITITGYSITPLPKHYLRFKHELRTQFRF